MNSGNNSTATLPASSSSSSLSIQTARPSNISNSKPITESKAENDKELNIHFKTPIIQEDGSDNEDDSYAGPFFRLGAELKTTPAATKTSSSTYTIPTRATKEKGKATQSQQPQQSQQSEPQQTAVDAYAYSDPNAMYSYGTDPSAYYQYYQQQEEQQEYNSGQVSNTNESESSVFGDLDDTAITRLTGKRKGRDSQIQIKTVNQNDILPSEQDWKYNAQPISTPKFVTNASQVQATGLQKKKNNIMSLISHAQSMQDRLDEQFASGRTAQNEARRKYGF
ncbi:mitotic checkpoint regulator, MAD2B-interacting-domain-containing protein [Circinella umbellata]|nr:mitotic checkpoint regulator, MAD2B-interacting-domain-containing protein [Circinella umbellata]